MGALEYKFPRTPHLYGSNSSHDDRMISLLETNKLLSQNLRGEEKIDGTNVGIFFDEDCNLKAQNRGHILGLNEHLQYFPFKKWLSVREESLFDILGDTLILFGEWCYAKHQIYYDKLPSYFIGFDLFNKKEKKFLPRIKLNDVAEILNISLVPVLFENMSFESIDDMKKYIKISNFGSELMEGIYIRTEDDSYVSGRYKFVRDTFKAGITDHWRTKPITPNKVISYDF